MSIKSVIFTLAFILSWVRFGLYSQEYFKRTYTIDNGLASPTIQDICRDRQGNVWAAASFMGIVKIIPTRPIKMKWYKNIIPGVPHNYATSVLVDNKGDLWAGVNDRLFRWQNNDFISPHPPVKVKCGVRRLFNGSSGRVWIGTESGVSCYYRERDQLKQIPPQLELLYLDAAGTTYSLDRDITLDHHQDDLIFYFRGISFIDEKAVRYNLKLEGFDQQWSTNIRPTNNQVRYNNLSPGNYRFYVQAVNLQIISSLLDLQADTLEIPRDSEILQVFEESKNRIRSMTLIHENLYQTRDLARIDVQEYIRELVDHFIDTYENLMEKITPRIQVDHISLNMDTAIPIGLILSELISNALKHAFPPGEEGEIHISLHSQSDGTAVLRVSDNGIGLPRDKYVHQNRSLGLQLVTLLTQQVKGTLDMDGSSGTTVTITFPYQDSYFQGSKGKNSKKKDKRK